MLNSSINNLVLWTDGNVSQTVYCLLRVIHLLNPSNLKSNTNEPNSLKSTTSESNSLKSKPTGSKLSPSQIKATRYLSYLAIARAYLLYGKESDVDLSWLAYLYAIDVRWGISRTALESLRVVSDHMLL